MPAPIRWVAVFLGVCLAGALLQDYYAHLERQTCLEHNAVEICEKVFCRCGR